MEVDWFHIPVKTNKSLLEAIGSEVQSRNEKPSVVALVWPAGTEPQAGDPRGSFL